MIAALKKHYGASNVLMMGDALGDYKAASEAGTYFYPICPNKEDRSWKEFYETVSEIFLSGGYNEEVQKNYVDQLDACLADAPEWDTV